MSETKSINLKTNLFDLIELGSGFDDSTFWKSVYHSQAEIVRREPTKRYEKVIKVSNRYFIKTLLIKIIS